MAAKPSLSEKTDKKRSPEQIDFSSLPGDTLSHVGVATYIVQDGVFVYTSPLYQKLTGYSKTDLIGGNPLDYLHPSDREVTRRNAITSLKEKRTRPYEYRFIRKNGEEMWTLERIASVMYRGKRASLGSFMDITERKRMEGQIRQSEEKYRNMIEQMKEGYFEVDVDGKMTFVNDAQCRILGYSREELLGMDGDDYLDEEESRKISALAEEIAKTGVPLLTYDVNYTKRDGAKEIHEISLAPTKDSWGNITGFRGVARDVTGHKHMEQQIRQSEERYRGIIEQMEEGYFEVDIEGYFTFVNDAECRNLGYSREELIGKDRRLFTDEKNAKVLLHAFDKTFNTGQPVRILDVEVIKKDGTKAFNEISASLIRDSQGKPIGFRGISRDITERKAMEEQIRQSEEKYRSIIEEMEEWYFETDLAGTILFSNDILSRDLGYSPEELVGANFRTFVREEDRGTFYNTFHQVYKTGEPMRNSPHEFIRPDGSSMFAEFSIFLKRDREGKAVGFRGVAHDITERKRAEEKIQYLATHDTLTGLPNRLMFSQLLNHAIQGAKRYERQLAVLFFDLDRFKIINDTLGHEAGDQLLQEIATRLRERMRTADVIARLGGDEFVILIEEVTGPNQLPTIARNVLSTVIKPATIMGQECRITASIGISIYPKDGMDEQTLMKNADIAMYFAKEEGKNNYQFYSRDIKPHSFERFLIETNLRQALNRKELSLHYQAKLDFKTGVITGVEALLRWENPSLGSIPPLQFIPVAEETGLIIPIGKWVLETACAQNVAWQRQGLPPVRMAVNLSPRQISDESLIKSIKTALQNSGMAPNLLELEITESMVMQNPERMIRVLSGIKDIGVRLAIDDFGTGYSSLSQIKHFPIDTLKVDRSFIRNIPDDPEDKAITEAVIAMGKTLSLTVVAEGVETQEQMVFLKQHACDEMQGYHFSKPVKPDEFADLLRSHTPPQKEKR